MDEKKARPVVFATRLLWAVLSLIVSVLLWVYVTTSEGDVTEQTFDGVQVVFNGQESLMSKDGLAISNVSANTVSIRIRATRRELIKLSSNNLVAFVDVSKFSARSFYTQAVSVQLPLGTNSSAIDIVSTSPSSISFNIDKTSTKTVELQGRFSGTVAAGFAAQPIQFEPETVTVSGPESDIARVAYAWVEVGRQDADKTIQSVSAYDLMDENGNVVDKDGFVLSDETVSVTVPVTSTKEVPLTADLVDGGGATAENVEVTCSPATITIAGDAEILEGINKISLGTIDLTSFTATFEDSFQIVLDNNVTNVTGIKEARLTLRIVGLETKKFNVSNITTTNAPSGRTVTIVTENVEITLRGKSSILDKIEANNIHIVADLADIGSTTGVFQPPVKVYVDGYTEVGAIGDYSDKVYIKIT